MAKAIRTRYSGPTDTRGSRITADDGDGNRISLSREFDNTVNGSHRTAAYALMDKMGWTGAIVGGWFKNDCYWVFVP